MPATVSSRLAEGERIVFVKIYPEDATNVILTIGELLATNIVESARWKTIETNIGAVSTNLAKRCTHA